MSMIGIIICTHSNLASGLYDAVEMISGHQENFEVVGFHEGEDMQSLSDRLVALAKVYEEASQRYVILVDLFGATPFNASAAGLSTFDTSIITGVNLPLLLELVTARKKVDDYDAFLEKAVEGAIGNIRIVNMKKMFQ